ncbi:MAG: hypothetical protein HQL90_11645 [Magnetococcales bacterium]|nr:hypothetical protein [Magnetococcales bacterium]
MTTLSGHAARGDAKLITCILPDDGRDRELLKALRAEHAIITANTFQCRGIVPGGSKRDKGLSVNSVRVVTVVVASDKADALFEYIYFKMGFDQPIQGGSILYQGDLLGATPFQLPTGVAEESED